MRTALLAALVGVLVVTQPGVASAGSVVLNFDSVSLAPGTCANASGYLSGYGVTFSPVSAGTSSVICNSVATSATAVSGVNVFYALPAVANNDLSYDLLFSTPLTELSFTRAAVDPGNSLPAWNAYAYDASNALLDSIVQPALFPGPPAAVFTLSGAGITRLRFDAFNSAQRTFNHPPIDDMVLTKVPEAGTTLMLLGSALTSLGVLRRKFAARGR